jgi:hypothetical protein
MNPILRLAMAVVPAIGFVNISAVPVQESGFW